MAYSISVAVGDSDAMETGSVATVTSPLLPVTVTGKDAAGAPPAGAPPPDVSPLAAAAVAAVDAPAVELPGADVLLAGALADVLLAGEAAGAGLLAQPTASVSDAPTAASAVRSRGLKDLRCNDMWHPPSVPGGRSASVATVEMGAARNRPSSEDWFRGALQASGLAAALAAVPLRDSAGFSPVFAECAPPRARCAGHRHCSARGAGPSPVRIRATSDVAADRAAAAIVV